MDTFNLIHDEMLHTRQCDTEMKLEVSVEEDHNSDPDYQMTE